MGASAKLYAFSATDDYPLKKRKQLQGIRSQISHHFSPSFLFCFSASVIFHLHFCPCDSWDIWTGAVGVPDSLLIRILLTHIFNNSDSHSNLSGLWLWLFYAYIPNLSYKLLTTCSLIIAMTCSQTRGSLTLQWSRVKYIWKWKFTWLKKNTIGVCMGGTVA